MIKGRRGSVTLYMTFIITAIILVMIGAVVAPIGVIFSAEMYEAGENLLLDANESIQSINNATIRGQVETNINEALGQTANNIDVSAALFQYSWVFVIVLVGLIAFLVTRQLVEYGAGGGFV